MNIKKSFYSLLAASLLSQGSVYAQLFTTVGTSPITFGVDSNALIFDTGTYGTGTLSLSGAGTRMFFYPGKAAFRAGNVGGTQWDDSNIGQYSVAFGYNTTASGTYSFASGQGSSATGGTSIAMGYASLASNALSIAIGGQATASGLQSTAIGQSATATGGGAIAVGSYNTASGTESMSMGTGTTASGMNSTAMGQGSTSSGVLSTAGGFATTANSYLSTTFGTWNLGATETGGTPSLTSWVSGDPLFEIGNGTSYSVKSDALVVYKNGDVKAHGILTAAPGGDIPMFTGY